jgi:hypothetical protein
MAFARYLDTRRCQIAYEKDAKTLFNTFRTLYMQLLLGSFSSITTLTTDGLIGGG